MVWGARSFSSSRPYFFVLVFLSVSWLYFACVYFVSVARVRGKGREGRCRWEVEGRPSGETGVRPSLSGRGQHAGLLEDLLVSWSTWRQALARDFFMSFRREGVEFDARMLEK